MSSSPSTATATIPVIDVSPWTTTGRHPDDDDDDRRAAVVSRVAAACRDVGFFAVTGHGLHDDDDDDEGVLGDALEASREFFDLPPERKLLARSDDPVTYPYGYENAERLARGKKSERYDDDDDAVTTADLKETWSMGPVGGDDDGSGAVPARRWPPEASPPTMASALTRYYDAMEKLSSTLLRILATALELSTSDWFADRRRDRHVSALRILHYFALEEDDDDGEGRRHGRGRRIRAGAHTDYGPLTVLYSGGPGLQVRIHHHNGDDDDDAWMDVPDLPGAFIVNLGDLMQRWTNDRWRSTLHRVVAIPDSGGKVPRRQSIAYFCNMNPDCVVDPRDLLVTSTGTASGNVNSQEPPHYPPITAKEHLMRKHLASMGQDEK